MKQINVIIDSLKLDEIIDKKMSKRLENKTWDDLTGTLFNPLYIELEFELGQQLKNIYETN